jgi:pimeloyl-ACP methyl ester carboxylesterase
MVCRHYKGFSTFRKRFSILTGKFGLLILRRMRHASKRICATLRKLCSALVLLCATLYLAACIGCASCQRRFIYFPPTFGPERVDHLAQEAKLERWRNSLGDCIGMKRLSPRQPAEGQILILYGNGSCAIGCAHYADVIQAIAAFDVFVMEYPGYADRPGSPSQKSLFTAADEALRTLSTNLPIYVVGESLGTGVACYLAGAYPDEITGVALLAPYSRLTDVAQAHMPLLPVRLLLVDRFPSQDHLDNYCGPVAMLVSGKDQVVPEKFGRRLYESYEGPKRLWEFPEGDHGTLMVQPPEIWGQIIDFWKTR